MVNMDEQASCTACSQALLYHLQAEWQQSWQHAERSWHWEPAQCCLQYNQQAASGTACAGKRPAPQSKLLGLLDRRHGPPATDLATSLSGSIELLRPGSTEYGSDLPDAGTMILAKMQGKVEVITS